MLNRDDKIKLLILHSISQTPLQRAVKLSYKALDAGISAGDIAVALSENILNTITRLGADKAVVRIGKYRLLLKREYSRQQHIKLVKLLKQLLQDAQLTDISVSTVD